MKLSRTMKRLLRRSESGQSLAILALGFVALLAFVGIVTDVSLMFVRFSQLTRAVDSASIAAAGQVRRQVPTQEELDTVCSVANPPPEDPCWADANDLAFARSFANIGIAARQFIEFYGFNPQSVLVDMCYTVARIDTTVDPPVYVPLDPELEDDMNQLCTSDQRKLIRVTAQVNSPTVFLRLLGFGDIPLVASSISETAVLDVILIMDVSESMLNETTVQTWADRGYTALYMPPRAATLQSALGYAFDGPGTAQFWQSLVQNDNMPVNAGTTAQDEVNAALNYTDSSNRWYVPSVNIGGVAPTNTTREACRVRFYPNAINTGVVEASWRDAYNNNNGAAPDVPGNFRWDGFIPSYDFYGCCNDPDGNGSFEDLLCQPFRDARDATEQFIRRIDFLRGDRVAFVTFDRKAFIMYVDGSLGGGTTHMIESEELALRTLRQYVGVRAEPSFYKPTTAVVDGETVGKMPWVGQSDLINDFEYPVAGACPFEDAVLEYPYSAFSSPKPEDVGYWGYTWDPARDPARSPQPLEHMKSPYGGLWDSVPGYTARYSYDRWASCSGTNMGAALREGSNALLKPRTRRTQGSVWVMVLLSDGAAGGTDPVSNGSPNPERPNTVPDPLDYPFTRIGSNPPFRVTYGGFGLCPFGRPGEYGGAGNAELVDLGESGYGFPFCSDELAETRHFCFDPRTNTPNRIELTDPFCNRDFYDPDDYARDWADFIAGIRSTEDGAQQGGLTQLPTIFAIGFGLNFRYGTETCKLGSIQHDASRPPNTRFSDAADCLGEELLRYISDVGDNFQIDTDYQQAYRDNMNEDLMADPDDYGPRGACEDEIDLDAAIASGNINNLVLPKPAGESCGNYFNAPGGEELELVFDEIASRMFTRLTR